MKPVRIKRRGSYLYTTAYRKLVTWALLVYLFASACLGLFAASLFERLIAGALIFFLALLVVAAIWILYLVSLWVFEREARQSVVIGEDGIREFYGQRERAFIPWAGVKEIELAATVVAGATLRVKGSFSNISISNVDLALTRRMRIREMHYAVGRLNLMMDLLRVLKEKAPDAEIRMSRLARRRYERQNPGNPQSIKDTA